MTPFTPDRPDRRESQTAELVPMGLIAFAVVALFILTLAFPLRASGQTCEQLPIPVGTKPMVKIEAVYHGPPEIALPASLGDPSFDYFDHVFGVLVFDSETPLNQFDSASVSPVSLSVPGSYLSMQWDLGFESESLIRRLCHWDSYLQDGVVIHEEVEMEIYSLISSFTASAMDGSEVESNDLLGLVVLGDGSFLLDGLNDVWWYTVTVDSGETIGDWEELWFSFQLRVDIDTSSIFADGFEAGDTGRWETTVN